MIYEKEGCEYILIFTRLSLGLLKAAMQFTNGRKFFGNRRPINLAIPDRGSDPTRRTEYEDRPVKPPRSSTASFYPDDKRLH